MIINAANKERLLENIDIFGFELVDEDAALAAEALAKTRLNPDLRPKFSEFQALVDELWLGAHVLVV